MFEKYQGNEVIFLVDDEPVVLSFARSILRHCGYRVVEFDNPVTALARLRTKPEIDLVLTDVMMPGMSGPDLVRQVKEEMPEVACLYMSGYDMNQISEQGLDAGCDYLRKPFTPEVLVKRVRAVLDEKAN